MPLPRREGRRKGPAGVGGGVISKRCLSQAHGLFNSIRPLFTDNFEYSVIKPLRPCICEKSPMKTISANTDPTCSFASLRDLDS